MRVRMGVGYSCRRAGRDQVPRNASWIRSRLFQLSDVASTMYVLGEVDVARVVDTIDTDSPLSPLKHDPMGSQPLEIASSPSPKTTRLGSSPPVTNKKRARDTPSGSSEPNDSDGARTTTCP